MKFAKIMIAFLIAIALVISSHPAAVFAEEIIKIGEVQTYSKLASFTHPYRNGWQLALEEINKAGGVMDKQIEVISRDDQGKPGEAVKIAEELVSKDKVALLMGSFFSNVGLAVTDFAGRNKVLYIAAEPLSDALVWAKLADAVVLVGFAGQTTAPDFKETKERFARIRARVLGAILSNVPAEQGLYRCGYGYRDQTPPSAGRNSKKKLLLPTSGPNEDTNT